MIAFRQKSLTYGLMECERLSVETIFVGNPRQTDDRVEVEKKREIGPKSASGKGIEFTKEINIHPPGMALIGDRRIAMAVAEYNLAFCKGGPDDLGDMIGPVGEEQKEFGLRHNLVAFQKHSSDLFPKLRRPGLSRFEDRMASAAQPHGDLPNRG